LVVRHAGFVVDLGMAFVDDWVVDNEKGFFWLSNDIVGLVGKQDDQTCLFFDPLQSFRK